MSRRFQFSLGFLLGMAGFVAVCVWEVQTDWAFGRMPDEAHQFVKAGVRVAVMLCAAIFVARAIWTGRARKHGRISGGEKGSDRASVPFNVLRIKNDSESVTEP